MEPASIPHISKLIIKKIQISYLFLGQHVIILRITYVPQTTHSSIGTDNKVFNWLGWTRSSELPKADFRCIVEVQCTTRLHIFLYTVGLVSIRISVFTCEDRRLFTTFVSFMPFIHQYSLSDIASMYTIYRQRKTDDTAMLIYISFFKCFYFFQFFLSFYIFFVFFVPFFHVGK